MNNTLASNLPNPVIVKETDRFLATCKPGGLLTQAPSGIDSMETRIKQYLARKNGNHGKVYLGVPHRLDRPSSGIMVFAKDKKAARFFAEQFQRRVVRKIYWAWVPNAPDESDSNRKRSGKWTDWMRKIPDEAKSEICLESDSGAQSAILSYQVAGTAPGSTLLRIELQTGRSHQIRVQASSRGLPLVGDDLYGSTLPFGPQTNDLRLRWIALHARELTVNDPETKLAITLSAEPPEFWPSIALT